MPKRVTKGNKENVSLYRKRMKSAALGTKNLVLPVQEKLCNAERSLEGVR